MGSTFHVCNGSGRRTSGTIPLQAGLQKIGMKHEGCQRAHVAHAGGFKDLELYGMLRFEFGVTA